MPTGDEIPFKNVYVGLGCFTEVSTAKNEMPEKGPTWRILELMDSLHFEILNKLVDSPDQQNSEKTNNAKIQLSQKALRL